MPSRLFGANAVNDEALDELFNIPFTLKRRPVAVSADFRPLRRLALLMLVLSHCRGNRANLEQLHVLNWAVRSERTRRDFLDFLNGDRSPDRAIVRYDPSLSRLIAFALAEKFVTKNERPMQQQQLPGVASPNVNSSQAGVDYRIMLAERGEELLAALKETTVLLEERTFLNQLKRKVTKQQIHDLLYWGLQ